MAFRPALRTVAVRATALALAAVLAGCGFQLRGTSPVPAALQPLAVKCGSQIPDTLCLSLKEQLELGGIETTEATNAAYVLDLKSFSQDRRASAITVRAAAAEYTLTQAVRIELITDDRVPLIADTELSVRESYRYDETNILAKQREQDELEQRMNDRLAQQILFRLAPMTEARIQAIREDYRANNPPAEPDAGQP
ncbi:LPS-assembly lipoprotein LptE [Marinobacter pelagius]|uniref:LPS-assembly lipoprotein LptE n=1 Tax=Marinobacter pelagius TaxID=379482 RepID=A0A1I4UP91_9GAMM|nr:LPS assembly lipoprotein LptE [Marinobacter pelagius]SFM90725.1 LPS-assembly lipoprotein [Marinobacter pelagius]